jgi:catechol 2,3-dioxygenase-like lactoylglutathione lyase family enzyme
MSVTNVESVTYGVDDLETSIRFWTDFGLTRVASAPESAPAFLAQDGSGVVLRRKEDPALPAAIEPGSTLREVTFGVSDAAALESVAGELARDRDVRTGPEGTVHTVDPLGFAISFRVAERAPVVADELKFNTPGRPDRLNTRGQFYESARPLELTHTVYMIDKPEVAVEFYTERLGFIVSDQYPGRGYFLRGGASSHHHNLFLLNVGGKRGFHHVAFELGNIHELFGGGLNMTRRGWRTALGPGRHPISSCYFWYFHCPSGGAAEYDFDSDLVDERWVPGSFEQTPEVFAEWCLAEGMADSLLYKGVQSSDTIKKKERGD